eukprot:gnl/TRDRNA2_/TRDRNA2_153082_c0_seq1.p1 gnl/TRDRNA2_/TRDRNA2_153082_c0~~gnl/TRDRNA2_/TRDRNA2_153082_c0_seq1.p1  ORF type:complete len:221 (+),score=47.01 gnl/TRDRNA2_/TRDRNA2_153082_c0_seq1:64-663(+)
MALYDLADMYMFGIGGEKNVAKGQAILYGGPSAEALPDEVARSQGWVRVGGATESYKAEMAALEEVGDCLHIRAPDDVREQIADGRSAPPESLAQQAQASEAVWRAAMPFGNITYGQPVTVTPAQAAKAVGNRTVVDIGQGNSICVELVAADKLDEFMARKQLPEPTSKKATPRTPRSAAAAMKRLAAGMSSLMRTSKR